MEKKLIYAVDDDDSIRELYSCALENDFDCRTFKNGKELLDALNKEKCDLILLDVMLSEIDGYTLLEKIKSDDYTKDISIIMVSAKGTEFNKVKGLNLGADDYISKPFGLLELIARINANLRKKEKSKAHKLQYKNLSFDDSTHKILIGNKELKLTLMDYKILGYFINKPNVIVTKDELFKNIWHDDTPVETRTIDIHISTLRKLLSDTGIKIETIRGVGYILK